MRSGGAEGPPWGAAFTFLPRSLGPQAMALGMTREESCRGPELAALLLGGVPQWRIRVNFGGFRR